jgi:cytochrome c oxidase assembly protein subunit 15
VSKDPNGKPAPSTRWLRGLTLAALALAAVVIVLGAWTRLADAGLGCPDWPGCYGHLNVQNAIEHVEQQNRQQPGALREADKTVPEMVHRYVAAILGLLITVLAGVSLYRRRATGEPSTLPLALLALVIFQGLLGMWTVTLGLHPAIVVLHLLGGFATFTLLAWFAARLYQWPRFINDCDVRTLGRPAGLALTAVILQIALGGWTTANYAAVACTELPVCEGDWVSKLDFSGAFRFWGHTLGERGDYEFGVLDHEARTTIHVLHRFGAGVVFLLVGGFCLSVWRRARCDFFTGFAGAIGGLLLLQLGLGVSNVVFGVPLAVAVGHNFVGALLLVSLVLFLRAIYREPERRVP